MSKQKALSTTKLMSDIVTDESIDAFDSAVNMLKQEYGEYQLTATMRKQLAEELGEDQAVVDTWQSIVDVLDHIDMVELAKKHPEAIGKATKTIVSVVSIFFPAARAADLVPQEFAAKLVGAAGMLTPEHLLNIIAKKQVEKNKKKLEEGVPLQEKPKPATDGLMAKISDGSKKTLNSISGLLPKKKANKQDEDVLNTIKKLSELKDAGVITQEEFDTKKAELLSKV